jgi:HEAT repeat protein
MSQLVDRIGKLLSQLQSPDFFEREAAVKELGTYREDEAVAGLVLAIEDPDLGIRELAAEFLIRMKGATAAQLLVRFLAHGDIGTRNLASEILVRFGSEAAPILIENLECDDHDVRKFIVDILGLIKDPSAVEPLCLRLWDDNPNVSCSAAEALGEIGSRKASTNLLSAFEKVEEARLPIVEALGKIGDPSTLEHIYGFLKSDDPVILYAAIEAIGSIAQLSSVSYLAGFLQTQDGPIAEAAMMAIIRISMRNGGRVDCDLPLDRFTAFLFDGMRRGNKEITEFTLSRLSHWYGNDVIKGLLDVIDVVDEDRLRRIADILSGIGAPAGRLIIEKFRTVQKNTKIRLIEIMKGLINEELAALLVEVADDPDPDVRQEITYVLGTSGFTGAIPRIKEMALDTNGHVRAAAYSALGWLCTEADIDFIFGGLEDKYPDVREAAMGALIVIGGQRVVAKFNADLFHEDVERQRLAVAALGMIGELDVVPPLQKAISHPDATVRKSAIVSLAKIGSVESCAPIALALSDESSAVRKAAVSALVSLRGAKAISDIRFLLDDEDVWVRYHTISAIAELRMPEFAAYITPYLNDDQDIIKIAAAKALAQMGAADALPELNRLRGDRNQDVSRAVDSAVATLEGGH